MHLGHICRPILECFGRFPRGVVSWELHVAREVKVLNAHSVAITNHCQSALTCGAPKESLESMAKAIQVCRTLHLCGDLSNDYLSLLELQVRLDASTTVELPIYRVCQNFFLWIHPRLGHFVSLCYVALRMSAIWWGVHLEQRYCVLCKRSIFKGEGAVSPPVGDCVRWNCCFWNKVTDLWVQFSRVSRNET